VHLFKCPTFTGVMSFYGDFGVRRRSYRLPPRWSAAGLLVRVVPPMERPDDRPGGLMPPTVLAPLWFWWSGLDTIVSEMLIFGLPIVLVGVVAGRKIAAQPSPECVRQRGTGFDAQVLSRSIPGA